MTFAQPVWLLCLVPAFVFVRHFRSGTRLFNLLRFLLVLALLLALAQPVLRVENRAGTVVVVVDRSKSMPENVTQQAGEVLDLIRDARPANSNLGIVSFGYHPAVEKFPKQSDSSEMAGQIDGDGSDLNRALEVGLGLIPEGGSGRLLVLSDGRWTGRDPRAAAGLAAARGIAVDYRLLNRVTENLAIAKIEAPAQVSAQEGMMIAAWIFSPDQRQVNYELVRDGTVIARGERNLARGTHRLIFRDLASSPGTLGYQLRITSPGEDPFPENNRADFLVGVRGPRAILLVSEDPNSSFANLLTAGGLKVTVRTPDQLSWSLADLSSYSALILENIPAERIHYSGMENIAAWVNETGAGLLTTGGKNSYGTGGWFKSPLDAILPVSMELRQEHRKLSLAMVIAADRSGSMGAVVGDRTKMELANLASAEVLKLLSPLDEFGMLAVDTTAHVIVDLVSVREKADILNRVLSIQSMGGGIYVYEALATAASMLQDSGAGSRHILLFADAADAEEPGAYKELLEKCAQAGITVSVVGLGTETDSDAHLLKDVASRGGGQIYFTTDANALPRIFAQDTFVVARSTFIEEVTPFKMTGGILGLSGFQFGQPPPMAGYNLCYLREGAELAAVTLDEYSAPVVATWYAGSGRVASYTGEAAGVFTGAVANWAQVGDFFTSLARWVAGSGEDFPGNSLLTQDQQGGTVKVTLHLDPERTSDPFSRTPELNLLRGQARSKPDREKVNMRWETPHSLVAELPLKGEEILLSSLALDGKAVGGLPPVRLPYSPEFVPVQADRGRAALDEVARTSSGHERTRLGQIWRDLPLRRNTTDLTPWLVLLAVCLLLLEVLERRTGWLGSLREQRLKTVKVTESPPAPSRKREKSKKITSEPEQQEKENLAQEEGPDGLQAALSKAGKRASQRKRR